MNFDREKKMTYENLLSQIGQLERIMFDLPGCVYWKNKDGVYLGCNQSFLEMVGLDSVDQMIGKTDNDFCWANQAEILRKHDREVMMFGRMSFEETVNLVDKTQLTYTVVKSPLHDEYGHVIGTIGTSLDITQQKKFQKELEEAKDKAEAANRVKSEFLMNMSHDVKTPLGGMISFSELLNSRVPSNLHDFTEGILVAGKQLMQFFDNCMELCKLENYAITLSKETFSLEQLLNEVLTLLQPAIKAKGLSLYIDYSNKIPAHLLGSRVSLYRILLNLIGNAVKFTKKGSIKVSAELADNSTSDKAIIKLTVADTGVGIPEDKQSLIFEKFSRITPSYEGIYEGHGIGLYVVREFVEAMHGEIHLKSEENKGSVFIIVIPLQKSLLTDKEYKDVDGKEIDLNLLQILPENNACQPSTEIKISKKINKPFKETKTTTSEASSNILVVEDNLMAAKAIRIILSALRCQVDLAGCGQEAITLFKSKKYDLIFMDIGLPDIKGYEVSKHLRKIEKGTSFNVPILGLSAHASQEEERLSWEAGMNEMLTKPLLIDQAEAVLERYNLENKLSESPEETKQNSQNFGLLAKGKSGLRVIDLEKLKTAHDLTASEQNIWNMIGEIIASLPETKADIELSYKAHDIETLIDKVHKFHGGICYTNMPDLLHAVRKLETSLKEGKLDKLDMLYQDFLQAIDFLEKVYQLL